MRVARPSTRKGTTWQLAALGLLMCAACNRAEEPRSGGDARPLSDVGHSEPSTPSAPNAATPAAAARAVAHCTVPMPDEPLPRAPNAAHCPADTEHPAPLAHGYVTFSDAPGAPRLEVELARSEPEKERGLMFRTKMPDEQGMLFSWGSEEPRQFWMHNTCIPLDMMFIAADGTIAGILEQVPTLNDAARGVPCPAAYVLEVNAGWSRSHGVKPGMVARFE
ncbi:MAG TPA: DUF192 domain-containing protein [Polyangiaceae bacterium]